MKLLVAPEEGVWAAELDRGRGEDSAGKKSAESVS